MVSTSMAIEREIDDARRMTHACHVGDTHSMHGCMPCRLV